MYKLFNQRDSFLFSIVRMPHIESNIPQINIYLTIKGEFLRLICSTLCLRDFISMARVLLERMKQEKPQVLL